MDASDERCLARAVAQTCAPVLAVEARCRAVAGRTRVLAAPATGAGRRPDGGGRDVTLVVLAGQVYADALFFGAHWHNLPRPEEPEGSRGAGAGGVAQGANVKNYAENKARRGPGELVPENALTCQGGVPTCCIQG